MSDKYHYSMVIRWSDEDAVFIVSLPEFGSGAKTHGRSYAEAVKHGREVLDSFVRIYKKDGLRLPRPRKFRDRQSA